MAQIPNISVEALDQYDHRLIDPNAPKVGEKRRKDQFKKLIAGTVEVMSHLTSRGSYFSVSLPDSWMIVFHLSSHSLHTESSVPAVQEGGAYPEPSVTL